MNPQDFEFIRKFLKQRSGLMLSADKQYLVESRLLPVAARAGLSNLIELAQKLRTGLDETLATQVVEAMTTNETSFFRDRTPFEQFRSFIIPALVQARARQKRIRIWCAAASTGQEPYSLAMALKDLTRITDGFRIDILATDISAEVLERAKAGIYSQFEVQRGLPITLLLRHFTQSGENWQISSDIRAMVQFRKLNLLEDFSQLGPVDLVFCRNVLIYFDQATKAAVLGRMARVVAPDGFLMLGGAETTLGLSGAFRSHPEQRSVFQPVPTEAMTAARSGAAQQESRLALAGR